jgi:KipI family sensor histidine kinase inhibitor
LTERAPRLVPFGDRALLVRTDDVAAAHALAAAVDPGRIEPPPVTIEEVVVGFACVLVVLGPDPDPGDLDRCAAWLDRMARDDAGALRSVTVGTTHVLPVVFDGADLDEVAAMVGLPPDRVVDLLAAAELEVAFVGFAPGFPYLTGLPPELTAVPRRSTPRTTVPAGSVAVAGGFASVYPRATPGGWHLLGRTSESLFDPDHPPYSRVAPGDRVHFVATDAATTPGPPPSDGDDRAPLRVDDGPFLQVLAPGLLDLIQDGGRIGTAGLGVPRAGAADPRALTMANLLLGNDPAAASIECTASGPSLRVAGDGHLTVVGAGPESVDVSVDGRSVPDAVVVPVRNGQVISVGRIHRGLRAYVAVAGGLSTPPLFGSRSSDVLSGLGSGALRAGDRLARGPAGRVRGRLDFPGTWTTDGHLVLRVLPGPHVIGDDGSADPLFDRMVATRWSVGPHVDRVGVRVAAIDGDGPTGSQPVASTPMVTGAVQLPPDGRPILLLPDHATVGGYPVVACVISADLPLLGRMAPGDEVELLAVAAEVAASELVRSRLATASSVSGWFPTTAGT